MEEELVLRIINEKLEYEHIAPEWLCDGICTRSEYDKYCTGEMDIDYLTLEMMLERLGMNSLDFISWVDYDVYEYLEWRDKTMEAIRAAGEAPYVVGSVESGEKGVVLC